VVRLAARIWKSTSVKAVSETGIVFTVRTKLFRGTASNEVTTIASFLLYYF